MRSLRKKRLHPDHGMRPRSYAENEADRPGLAKREHLKGRVGGGGGGERPSV